MTQYESAVKLAKHGLPVFPCLPDSKLPAIKNFTKQATTDLQKIKKWWNKNPNFNIGISTENLVAIDIDMKGGKNGFEEIKRLEKEGVFFPSTFSQRTPNNGEHRLYTTDRPVRSSVSQLGSGIDCRGVGSYVLGAGSLLAGRAYTAEYRNLEQAPDGLLSRLSHSDKSRTTKKPAPDGRLDRVRAETRAREYLEKFADIAVSGNGGDQTTFRVAAKVKDFGADEEMCFFLMYDVWNPRCMPPWGFEELKTKVSNAYQYGENLPGVDAPETQFDPVGVEVKKPEVEEPIGDPIIQLNKKFAYIGGNKGFIVEEKEDENENPCIEVIAVPTFHQNLLPIKVPTSEGKPMPLSKKWMGSPLRRSYDGLCFLPGKDPKSKYYNLWKGFKVKPHQDQAQRKSLEMFLEHAKENICKGDEELYKWLIGYFAHLIQKPWELPLVALVFRGGKGVGKNALVERVSYLLGNHATVVANKRHFLGNFNSLLENKLMLILDEAFWSGDKQAEGVLKDLITGTKHTIERKGHETYDVKNCLRVVILGNEDWLVPASEDERRFAVFEVGNGRKQDRKFFIGMREGMEAGGYGLLLSYLQKFDISGIEVGQAPMTLALSQQKESTLPPFFQWWFGCLQEGALKGMGSSQFNGGWPKEADIDDLSRAVRQYIHEHSMGGWKPTSVGIGKFLKKCAPSVYVSQKMREGTRVRVYEFPQIEVLRNEWDHFMGHKTKWETEGDITFE